MQYLRNSQYSINIDYISSFHTNIEFLYNIFAPFIMLIFVTGHRFIIEMKNSIWYWTFLEIVNHQWIPIFREGKALPYYPSFKVMALFPIQGHLAFWKIDLFVLYKVWDGLVSKTKQWPYNQGYYNINSDFTGVSQMRAYSSIPTNTRRSDIDRLLPKSCYSCQGTNVINVTSSCWGRVDEDDTRFVKLEQCVGQCSVSEIRVF